MTHYTLAELHQQFCRVQRNGFGWLEAQTDATRAVVLIHGVTGGKDDMLPLAERYLALGYAVYCPDLVGHGDSEMIAVRDFADLGRWFRDAVNEIGVTPELIVANSYSSAVVYSYLQQGFLPEQTSVILGCPTPIIAWFSRVLDRIGQVLPRRLMWFVYNTSLVQKIRVFYLYRGETSASRAWLVESEKRKYHYIAPDVSVTLTGLLSSDNPFQGAILPSDIQRRVTVVLGQRDNVIAPGAREFLHKILPDATFVDAGPAGHILHFEAIDALVAKRGA